MNQENVSPPQVLVLPFPTQGHINPMLQFAKRLVSKGLDVSLVTFCGNKPMAIQDYSSIKLEPVFDDLGADNFLEKSADDYLERFKAVVTLRLPQIMVKLGMSKSENPASCLVYDSLVPWALDIAEEQGVYGAEFFTMSCAVSTVYYNVYEGLLKVPIVEPCVSMAGLPLLQARDLPSFVYDIKAYPTFTQFLTNQFSIFKKADWVFFNTFTSLENEASSSSSDTILSPGLVKSPPVPVTLVNPVLVPTAEEHDDLTISDQMEFMESLHIKIRIRQLLLKLMSTFQPGLKRILMQLVLMNFQMCLFIKKKCLEQPLLAVHRMCRLIQCPLVPQNLLQPH
ncbi:hypothetical protein V6N13_099893 [Hibiscus sabdariffa]